LLMPSGILPSSANGAPIHLVKFNGSATTGRARTASVLTHVALLAGILLLKISSGTIDITKPPQLVPISPTYFPVPQNDRFGQPSLGKKSGGGEQDPRPAGHGLLAPTSSIPLAPPRRIQDVEAVLMVPASVLDPNASQFPVPVTNLGLPWMKKDWNSAG